MFKLKKEREEKNLVPTKNVKQKCDSSERSMVFFGTLKGRRFWSGKIVFPGKLFHRSKLFIRSKSCLTWKVWLVDYGFLRLGRIFWWSLWNVKLSIIWVKFSMEKPEAAKHYSVALSTLQNEPAEAEGYCQLCQATLDGVSKPNCVGLWNLTVFDVKKHSINRFALMNIDTNLTGRKKQEAEKIFQ